MFSFDNSNVKYQSFIKTSSDARRRTFRRKPMQRMTAVFVLTFIVSYYFVSSYINEKPESKSVSVSNDTLVQVTIQMIPDLASDFQLTALTFSAVQNSIFFIKVSDTGDLSSRQACSIESAARTNPDRNISVIYIEPVPRFLNFGNLAVYLTHEYNNIMFFRAPVSIFVNDTPLEGKDENTWVTSKESMIKYLSFYKFGGTYLELDMIVTRSFASLPWNWVVKENNKSLATGAMSLIHAEDGKLLAIAAATAHELLAARALRIFEASHRNDTHDTTTQAVGKSELWENSSPKNWTHKMVRTITRAMQKFCTTQDVVNMTAVTCSGIEVLEPKYFYPITYWPLLFEPGNITEEAYAYHFWHDLSKSTYVERRTVIDKLASKFCPNVYAYFIRMLF